MALNPFGRIAEAWHRKALATNDAAGMLLGVEVLDHIIVGDAGYYSFQQCGCL